jgi:peptidoglycan L-alanyl-D-glutamate endopeptidase CwlK
MPKFGKRSRQALATCDESLQRLFNEVIKHIDCSVLEGHRNEDKQNEYYKEGKSKLKFPDGRHNASPSNAVDVTPYPVDWADRERQTLFAGFVMGMARSMGIGIRWGGDWDGDFLVQDNKFDDFPHFELTSKDLYKISNDKKAKLREEELKKKMAAEAKKASAKPVAKKKVKNGKKR